MRTQLILGSRRYRRWFYCFGVTAVVFAAAGCGGGGGAPASSDEVAAGQAAYRTSCAACHGLNAEGRSILGQNLHDNAFVQSKSDAELVEFIEKGRPATHPDNQRGIEMPPRGGNPSLTDADIGRIVAYLRSLQP